MDAATLRETQAPLKQRYRDDARSAQITLMADATLDGTDVTCSVQTGRALVEAGLHPATGGDGLAACSGDMLLQALVACAGVTLRVVATSMGLDVSGGRVHAEGDLDFRGTLGVDKQAPVGFTAIRLGVDLADAALDADQRATLLRLTERYCVVLQPCGRDRSSPRRTSRPVSPPDRPASASRSRSCRRIVLGRGDHDGAGVRVDGQVGERRPGPLGPPLVPADR